jgi:hypothetical protein
MNSQTRPRGGSHDEASLLGFNALWQTTTYDGTYQQPNIVPLFYFPLVPLPL